MRLIRWHACFVVLTLFGWTSVASANPLYAYVEIPFNDGTTKYDYFCLLWKTEWPVAVFTKTFDEGRALKYTANPSSRVYHIFSIRRLNQKRWVPLDLYVKMYDQPQPGWENCTPQLWARIRNEPTPHFVYHPATPGGGGESQGSWGTKDYRCSGARFAVDNPQICY